MVQNYMETLVDNALTHEFGENPQKYIDVCHCSSCIALIKAFALNQLKPFYVTTIAGEVFGEYQSKEAQNTSNVMVALGKGIDELKNADPHHNGGLPITSTE